MGGELVTVQAGLLDVGTADLGAAHLGLVLVGAFISMALAAASLVNAVRLQGARWRERFGADLGLGLRQSFVHLDVDRLFMLNLLALGAAAGGVLWLTGQALAAFIALLALGAVPGMALAWLRRERLNKLSAQWPDAVMLVASALRAGSSLAQGLGQAARELPAPAGLELSLAVREQRLGVSLDDAMAHLERRVRLEAVTLFAASVRIAQETGGNLAETLERLADTLRRKASLEGKIDALTAQGRMQGWVMAALPLAVGAALFAIEPQAMSPLVTTWQGWCVCAGVVLLEGLGLFFIRKIVSIDV
jgi:tight adherence protein B